MDESILSHSYAIYNSPVGFLKIGYYENHITCICYVDASSSQDESLSCDLTDKAYKQLMEYFEGKRKEFDIPLLMIGTDFQKSVWNELLNIPYGETRSYKQIAEAIGNPKAVRAVGMANNKNPLAIVVPCHRVIGCNGKLVGYAGGVDVKKYLLSLEKSTI